VNLEDLREIQRKERKSDELVDIDDDFYIMIGRRISELESEAKRETNQEAKLIIMDEINSIRKVAEGIFERRIGKILRMAPLHLKGLNVETDNMVSDEEAIFRDVCKNLKEGREAVLSSIISSNSDELKEEKDENGEQSENTKENFNKSQRSFRVARVLENFPEFIATDHRIYNLNAEDVVCLPKKDIEILVDKGVLEKLEVD